MVVVQNALLGVFKRAREVARDRSSCSSEVNRALEVDWRVARRDGDVTDAVRNLENGCPISMCVGVFALKPSDEVSVNEIEP